MPLIFKRTPGSTVGYEWTDPDQGVEVEDRELAYELLHMDADFYEESTEAQAEESAVELPPKTGAGSGVKVWRAFAAAKNVEVAEDASRDDVIEALETAGILTDAEGSQIEEAGSGDEANQS